MPVSPNNRAGNDDEPHNKSTQSTPDAAPTTGNSPDLGSSTGQTGQSRSSRRLKRQNLIQRFNKLREEAQLQGLIPTEPVGAIRDERVKTADQPQPKLIETAIRQGWAVPEEVKPELVAELTAIVTDDSEEVSDKTKVAAFRALLAADQAQHERDNPKTKTSGGQVNVSVQTNIAAVDVLRSALARQDIKVVEDNKSVEDK